MVIFERFAAAFPLVSNEDERWARAGPLTTDLARAAGGRKGRVLDLACGSGFHARHLALEGFEVTGVDQSARAIEAGRSLAGGGKVDWVEGDITRPVAGEYDLALLVGNTLSLFAERTQVERTVEAAARALVPRGVLVVHVIDYDYLRAHPVTIRRDGELGGRPVTFEKRIRAEEAGALITITVTTHTDTTPRADSGTQRLHEHGAPVLKEIASRFGLELRDEFGGMDRSARSRGETRDVVLVCEKPEGREVGR